MEGRILVAGSSAAFIVAAATVGIRLLLLARRSGRHPEFLLGTAFTCMSLLFVPLAGASGMGRVAVGEIDLPLLCFAILALWVGFSSTLGFVALTFRPHETWARGLGFGLSAVFAGLGMGLIHAIATSAPDANSFHAGQLWSGLMRGPMLLGNLWSLSEAFHEYARGRRRVRLGLGDPVVTNRFLLWGLFASAQLLMHATSLHLHARGMGIFGDPLALLVVATGGLSASIFMLLTFFPPARFVAFIERRAASSEPAPA